MANWSAEQLSNNSTISSAFKSSNHATIKQTEQSTEQSTICSTNKFAVVVPHEAALK